MSGPIGSSQWMYSSGSASFYSHTIDQSLRFNDGDSSYLTFTPSSATAGTWTVSFWVKRGVVSTTQYIFYSGAVSARGGFYFLSDDRFGVSPFNSSGANANLFSIPVFRDPAQWYHIVMTANGITTSNLSSNLNIYVNGVEISHTKTQLSSPTGGDRINDAQAKRINGLTPSGGQHFDGYLAEWHWIDGTVYDQNNFGEFKDGIWTAKEVTGLSYGAAGYYLNFADSSDIGNNALTTDGTNDWTPSGIVASDITSDSPTQNFAVLNPLDATIGTPGISEGNLRISGSGGGYDGTYATIAVTSGKWYVEFLYVSGDNRGMFGVAREDRLSYVNGSAYIGSIDDTYGIDFRARAYTGTSTTSSSGSQLFDQTDFNTGDIGLLCFDVDAGKLWFGRRDVSGSTTIWYDSSGNNNGDPSAGSNPTYTFTATGSTWFIGCHDYAGTELIANFGQDGSFAGNITSQGASDANGIGDFNYIESGFLAPCTSNLPDPTIGPGQSTQSDGHFNTVQWSGNGASSRGITGVGFQPDWVWIKTRNQANEHSLFDSVRGVAKDLEIDADVEVSNNVNGYLNSFDSDGFTVVDGSSGSALVNYSSGGTTNTYTSFNWLGGGSASTIAADSVSSGVPSISASVSANATAGFSIITYTTSDSTGTVGHGLGVQPQLLLGKNRNHGTDWYVHTPLLAASQVGIWADATAFYDPSINHWNDTYPTASVFSVGGYTAGHSDLTSPSNKVVYAFANVEGHQKIGLYIGNNAADGTFVYTGFRPRWVMLKDVSNANIEWNVYYDEASPFNVMNDYIAAGSNAAEATDVSTRNLDFLSNGFKLRDQYAQNYATTYLYLAIAQAPFKFANAR